MMKLLSEFSSNVVLVDSNGVGTLWLVKIVCKNVSIYDYLNVKRLLLALKGYLFF